jgi:hypothetical protein
MKMNRSACLVALLALASPAYADSYSFVVGGRHITVEASRHCRSLSCVSWSETKKRDRTDATASVDPAPAPAPVVAVAPAPAPAAVQPPPAPVAVQPPAPAPVAVPAAVRAPQPQIAVASAQTPPAPVQPQTAPVASSPATVDTRTVAVAPPAPPVAPVTTQPPAPPPAVQAKPDAPTPHVGFDVKQDVKPDPKTEAKAVAKTDAKTDAKAEPVAPVAKAPAEKPKVEKPAILARPAPQTDAAEALGDWQTEGNKGLVRIEPCGSALCGYMVNASTNGKGETVLINMKPKTGSQWSGSIYSRASGNTYYATMTVKHANTLRVEACVVGRFFCSGNDWTRVAPKAADEPITREASAAPGS